MDSQNTCNGFKKINDDNWIDDNTCMYIQIAWQSAMLDWEKKQTKRQQRLKKTSDSLYIKLAGRKTAIMAITAELEHVKALFNSFIFMT